MRRKQSLLNKMRSMLNLKSLIGKDKIAEKIPKKISKIMKKFKRQFQKKKSVMRQHPWIKNRNVNY